MSVGVILGWADQYDSCRKEVPVTYPSPNRHADLANLCYLRGLDDILEKRPTAHREIWRHVKLFNTGTLKPIGGVYSNVLCLTKLLFCFSYFTVGFPVYTGQQVSTDLV